MVRNAQHTIKQPWHGEAGLTLLELVIAAGIMGLAFVYLFGSLFSISDANAFSRDRTQAMAQVSAVLEQARSLSYDQLIAFTPPAPQGLGVRATTLVHCINAAGAAIPLPAAAGTVLPNPVEVRVTVTWVDAKGRPASSRASMFCRR